MALAFQHRTRQLAIRAATLAILARLWRSVDVTRLRQTIQPFADSAALAVNTGFMQSAQAAAAYYILTRPRGITSVVVPQVTPLAAELAADKIRGAAISGIINGRRAGQTIERAAQNGFVKASGSASSLILDGGRQTILEATAQDPAATGKWARVAGPTSCEFCSMLASRGPVYSSSSVEFASHDHCGCSAAPEFR